MASGKSDEAGKAGADNPFGLPNFDLTAMLENFRVPGMDMTSLLEREQRNIDAVRQANEAVAEGWQKLAARQADIFRESMAQWQQAMQNNMSARQVGAEEQAELMRQGFEQALENMREMAEIAAESQTRAFEIVRARVEESINEFFDRSGDRQD